MNNHEKEAATSWTLSFLLKKDRRLDSVGRKQTHKLEFYDKIRHGPPELRELDAR